MLCAVGDLIEDVVVQLRGGIQRDTDSPATIVRRRGGSAANVAYFAAKIAGRSRFVGCVGDDPLGDSLVAQMAAFGVDVRGERKGRTGSIVVVATSDGDRTMLTDRGDATMLLHFDPVWLDEVSVLHLPLYSFSHEPIATTVRRAVEVARDRDVPISLDLSSVALIDQLGVSHVQLLIEAIQPDTLFCTTAEAVAAGIGPKHRFGAKLIVVKDGPRPIRVIDSQGKESHYPVNAVTKVVDGTGAGDAFAAGFLCVEGNSSGVADRVRAGHVVASRVVVRAGATLEDS